MDTKQLKNFTIQLCSEAGEYLRNRFYTIKNIVRAENGAQLAHTEVELAGIIRRRINEVYPEHTVVIQGEETKAMPDAEHIWYVDALDGSGHFVRNIPLYTVNVALRHKQTTLMAAVSHPQTHELFFAEQGRGAFCNGLRISVAKQAGLSECYVAVELPEQKPEGQLPGSSFTEKMTVFQKLVASAKQVEAFRVGAFGQCLVANGAFDCYVDLSGTSRAVSQLASQLIVREAGGEVVDIVLPQNGFVQTIMATPALMPKLKKILNLKS